MGIYVPMINEKDHDVMFDMIDVPVPTGEKASVGEGLEAGYPDAETALTTYVCEAVPDLAYLWPTDGPVTTYQHRWVCSLLNEKEEDTARFMNRVVPRAAPYVVSSLESFASCLEQARDSGKVGQGEFAADISSQCLVGSIFDTAGVPGGSHLRQIELTEPEKAEEHNAATEQHLLEEEIVVVRQELQEIRTQFSAQVLQETVSFDEIVDDFYLQGFYNDCLDDFALLQLSQPELLEGASVTRIPGECRGVAEEKLRQYKAQGLTQ